MKIGALVEDLIQLKKNYDIHYPDDNIINLACNIIENIPDQQITVAEWLKQNGRRHSMNDVSLSKDEFVDCIDRLREATDLQDEISELMRKSRDNIENDFMNGAALQINHEPSVIKLLTKIMHDDEMYPNIDYFIYELDYGREYKPGTITDNDGNEINFSTADKLYDHLIDNLKKDET